MVSRSVPSVTLTRDLMPSRHGVFHLADPILWQTECEPEPCVMPVHPHGVLVTKIGFLTWDLERDNAPPPGVALLMFGPSTRFRIPMPIGMYFWPFGSFRQEHEQPRARRLFGWFLSALLLLNQRVLTTESQEVDRPARRRLDRQTSLHARSVEIVQLRRAVPAQSDTHDSKTVEWSHQWIVSGHWRQQFYPSTGEHRPVFVLPYVKGPENKPLKPPRAKVFAVVR